MIVPNATVFRPLTVLVLACLAAWPARAQWAVIDAPAIAQLIHQVQTMAQQLQIARDQLARADRTLQSMTGDRGMERLLAGVPRNYLPADWLQLSDALQGGGAFPGLAADVRSAVTAMAVLTPMQLSALPAAEQRQIVAARHTSALQLALTQAALANTSGRFASIQGLIAAIPAARDQKAILDLQARIGAELGMLQNEQTKLQILNQATAAQASVDRQRERERSVAGHGRFESRFQPTPAW